MHKLIRRRTAISDNTFDTLHPLVARIYRHRGVQSVDELAYTLDRLPSPQLLKGLPEALVLLEQAIRKQWRVRIVGDFDADGATSCALGVRALRAFCLRDIDFIVPNRFEYGYGLTPEIVDVVAREQPQLIITVDSGISCHAGVARARELGIKVLVTDHHLPSAQLPPANAVVNPNQHGCTFPSKTIAGVGVLFFVLLGLRRALRESGYFTEHKITEPNLADYLDIVALGTVADVVALDHLNRTLVQQGLLRIRAGRAAPGILALLQVAGRDARRITATDLAFAVGPRLNAAGRLDDITEGIRCLLTDSREEAHVLAADLDALNRERRDIEQSMQREAQVALDAIENHATATLPHGVALYEPTWHQGVIGILASRVKEKLHRPVFIFADADAQFVKGSGRSIAGFHLRDALERISSVHPGLITRFGGHAMAAGLTLPRENIAVFSQAFDAVAREWLDDAQLQAVIHSDGELLTEELSLATAEVLQAAGPWGQHFPEPVFDGVFEVLDWRIVGEKHIKMRVRPVIEDALGTSKLQFDAIQFFADHEFWSADIQQVQLVYRLDINEYRGKRSLQLMVEDVQAV